MSTGLGPHLDIGNNEQEKKDFVQSQTSIGKNCTVPYLLHYDCYGQQSRTEKTVPSFVHLFICIALCIGPCSGVCSVSVLGFLVRLVSK